MSFKYLRKTGSSLVRRIAPERATELSSMYLSHGEGEDSDDQLLGDYADRPWKKLHRVLRRMGRILAPIFASVPEPWQTKTCRVTPVTLQKMVMLRQEGKTLKEIGEAVGLHWTTVARHLKNQKENV